MLTIEEINTFEDFQKLEPVWNELLSQSDVDCPFLTFEWISCWWRSFGSNSKLSILLIKKNHEIVVIAPLMICKQKTRRIPLRTITFTANYHSNRSGFIFNAHNNDFVIKMIEYLRSNTKFDLIFLDLIENNTMTEAGIKTALHSIGLQYTEKRGCFSPRILINKRWDEFYKEKSKKMRMEINNKTNLLKRQSGFRIERFKRYDYNAFSDLLNISQHTWQYKNNTAIASNLQYIQFYRSLAEAFSNKGWLNLYILKINDEPVAFEFVINYKDKAYLLKIGFNVLYEKFSPGLLLLTESIKNAFDEKLKEYDFLGENDLYKMKWTSSCREHKKYLIFNSTILGNCFAALETKIIPFMKQIPFICKK